MEGRSEIRCPECDYEFPTSICDSCGAVNLRDSSYCCQCGEEFIAKKLTGEETSIDWENRRLCSDGNCIGVINEQGMCNICGKPYTGEPE